MTIVVGFTRTAEGQAALEFAIDEARLRQSRLVVLTSHRGGSGASTEAIQEIKNDLHQVRLKLDAAGVNHDVRAEVRGNDPSEDLITVAEEESAEFIVIGMRRRSAVGKLVLGSNSQRTLLDSPCPVIAVHGTAP